MMQRNSLSGLNKRRRALTLALVAVAIGGASGCDDPFGLKATVAVATDTSVAYAMTGTQASYPSGLNAATGGVSRIGADIAFDVAFDLTTDSKVRLIPARLISPVKTSFGGTVATQQVGLLTPTGTFEAVTKAPGGGYKRDSVVVVGTNQPVVIEVVSESCQFTLASILYAKIVIDSVNTTTRQIFFRATRNPNCGFKSFQPGVPKD